jgi:ankyrin repeat protein
MVTQDLASRDVSSFARSCQFLHATLTPILYRSVRDDGNLLLWAAHWGRVGTVEKLLAAGAQPDAALRQRELLGLQNGAGSQKRTHGTVRRCSGSRAHWPCAKSVTGAMFYCCTALHLAARAGHVDVIDVLLRNGADINAPSRGVCDCYLPYVGVTLEGSDGTPFWTALHTAICHKNEASVELLMSRGASFNVASWDEPIVNIQVTALHSASAVGALDIAKSLIRHYQPDIDTKDHNDFSPVSWAYLAGQAETMKLLLDGGADINAIAGSGRSLLVDACATGRFKEAFELLELGADVRYAAPVTQITALHFCCNQKQSETISSRFRNVTQFTDLEDWARLAEALLKAGADVNAKDLLDETTPIMRASRACFPPIIRVLLAHGANVNDRQRDGTTPLLAACLQWKNDPVQFWQMTIQTLLENGADVNARDARGTTPLLAICNSKMCIFPDSWLEVLQLLLEHGADVNARNESGTSPILAVCGLRHGVSADPWQVSVELLLEHGASIEYRDNPAGTVIEALCPAAWRSRPSRITQDREPLVKLLLGRGASPDASSPAMESPISRFFLDNSLSIPKILLNHGARPPKPTELRKMINHAVIRDEAEALRFALAFEGAKKLMATKSRLYMALKRGAHNVAEILLDEGAP